MKIANENFRRMLLSLNGLSAPPDWDFLPSPRHSSGPRWAKAMIQRLGFVQVDSVSAIERAQNHILFSRNHRFEKTDLRQLLEEDRALFENWTHDAAIIPSELYPYWKHYFERARTFEAHPGYRRYFAPVTPKDTAKVLRRIQREGALKPRDFNTQKVDFKDDYFAKPTLAKLAMELLWRTGELAISRRDGRERVYDLSERVIPKAHFEAKVSKSEYIDWACRESLKRLGVGTASQMARFFDAVSKAEAADWCQRHRGKQVSEVQVEQADGSLSPPAFALRSLLENIQQAPAPPPRLRLINPFDPLIRDRQRTRRIFGFDYTLEIWVPRKKRRYGYYVLPILEGDRFTGRVDAKVERREDRLNVLGLWWEDGVKTSKTRMAKLEKELRRLAEFAGVNRLVFAKGFARNG